MRATTRIAAASRPIASTWDSVAVVTKWDGGKFVEAELHPITLGYQTPRSERGRPKLASGADATRILDMMVDALEGIWRDGDGEKRRRGRDAVRYRAYGLTGLRA